MEPSPGHWIWGQKCSPNGNLLLWKRVSPSSPSLFIPGAGAPYLWGEYLPLKRAVQKFNRIFNIQFPWSLGSSVDSSQLLLWPSRHGRHDPGADTLMLKMLPLIDKTCWNWCKYWYQPKCSCRQSSSPWRWALRLRLPGLTTLNHWKSATLMKFWSNIHNNKTLGPFR